jgi:hypothetical protein
MYEMSSLTFGTIAGKRSLGVTVGKQRWSDPKPGDFELTFHANKLRLGPTITANELRITANSI